MHFWRLIPKIIMVLAGNLYLGRVKGGHDFQMTLSNGRLKTGSVVKKSPRKVVSTKSSRLSKTSQWASKSLGIDFQPSKIVMIFGINIQ